MAIERPGAGTIPAEPAMANNHDIVFVAVNALLFYRNGLVANGMASPGKIDHSPQTQHIRVRSPKHRPLRKLSLE